MTIPSPDCQLCVLEQTSNEIEIDADTQHIFSLGKLSALSLLLARLLPLQSIENIDSFNPAMAVVINMTRHNGSSCPSHRP